VIAESGIAKRGAPRLEGSMDEKENKQEPKKASSQDRTKESPQVPQSQLPQLKRLDDYESLYANNVRFETSVWDLKLLFGLLDQGTGGEVIEIHTGMSIPWATAKLMAFYLRLNIMIHEMENGKIWINPRVYPTEIPPLGPELENNEMANKARETAIRLREEFIRDQHG
jgi:uncharacterized protein DUF3467